MALVATNRSARLTSAIMYWFCVIFTIVIVSVLVVVTGYLVFRGLPQVHLSFFTQDTIPQKMDGYPGGMRAGLVGTSILIGMASLVGIPLGMLTGVYLSEYGANSPLASPVRFICDVLSGVPSIVVGILWYELLVRPVHHFNGWAGAMALAFIMAPIIARTTEEMLLLVPKSYREASIALGATKARTIIRVVIPSATGSLITGVMLALARVAGETAPLLFTALGYSYLTTNLNLPFPSLTKQIYDNAMDANEPPRQLAWGGILILISLIFVLNLSIRYFARSKHAAS